jgi:hypothetical protein
MGNSTTESKRIQNGLFVLIGESFRTGGQFSRIKGNKSSYSDQMAAVDSVLTSIKLLEKKFNVHVGVSLGTYFTQYTSDLVKAYSGRLVGKPDIRDSNTTAGLNPFFQTAIERATGPNQTLEELYDFIFYCRIDLFLKPTFHAVLDLSWSNIRFPFICWKRSATTRNHHPRVSDAMLFFPSHYFKYMAQFVIGHDAWSNAVTHLSLTYDDMDVMITTFHDSDSQKDWNPLYRVVNRPESISWSSLCLSRSGCIFDKFCPAQDTFSCTQNASRYLMVKYLPNSFTRSKKKIEGGALTILIIFCCLALLTVARSIGKRRK